MADVVNPPVQGTVRDFGPVKTVAEDGTEKRFFLAHVDLNLGEGPQIVSVVVGVSRKQRESGVTQSELGALGFESIEAAARNPAAAVGKTVAVVWREYENARNGGSWRLLTTKHADPDEFLTGLD